MQSKQTYSEPIPWTKISWMVIGLRVWLNDYIHVKPCHPFPNFNGGLLIGNYTLYRNMDVIDHLCPTPVAPFTNMV